MNKYIITQDQLNVIIKLVSEQKLKDSIGAYQIIQGVLQRPYIEPKPVEPKPVEEPKPSEEVPVAEEVIEPKKKKKKGKKK